MCRKSCYFAYESWWTKYENICDYSVSVWRFNWSENNKQGCYINVAVSWLMNLCTIVGGCLRFGGTYCFHFQGWSECNQNGRPDYADGVTLIEISESHERGQVIDFTEFPWETNASTLYMSVAFSKERKGGRETNILCVCVCVCPISNFGRY